MTMRLRNEFDHEKMTIDLNGRYRYTWPGQAPRVVSGAELATICAGANPAMLAIEDVTAVAERPTEPTIEKKEGTK